MLLRALAELPRPHPLQYRKVPVAWACSALVPLRVPREVLPAKAWLVRQAARLERIVRPPAP